MSEPTHAKAPKTPESNESIQYGGHYGPEFAHFFQTQNAAIDGGSVKGQKINITALGINNGWFDPTLQYIAGIDFSFRNSYKPLITAAEHTSYTNIYNQQCVPALQPCNSVTGENGACSNADNVCQGNIEGPISQSGDWDVYDIRAPSNDPFPPTTYVSYLADPAVMKAIGAKSSYSECSNSAGTGFSRTGDNSRSFLPTLSTVVGTGLRTVVWAGDADWICNWFGGLAAANHIDYSGHAAFAAKALVNYTLNGTQKGTFKTEGNLSFLRVFGAGHEVPAYKPGVSLQVFVQTMKGLPLSST